MSQGEKERNYLFDNMKAILVFSVVYAHYTRVCGDYADESLGGVIYAVSFSYIMQGFLFVSGYFSKNVDKCRKGAVKAFLFPYLVLMPIMYGVRYLLNGHATLDYLNPTMALWYLLVMFYYRFFIKDLSRIPYILPISFAVGLLSGFVPFLTETAALGRAFGFLPFYMLGYFCTWEVIEKVLKIPKWVLWLLLLLLVGFAAFLAFSDAMPLSMLYLKRSYQASGMDPLMGLLARAVIYVVSLGWILVFLGLTSQKKSVLSKIGRNTLSVYVLHIIMRYLIQAIELPGAGTPLIYVLTLGLALFSVWLLSRQPVSDVYNKAMNGLYGLLAKGLGFVLRPLRHK